MGWRPRESVRGKCEARRANGVPNTGSKARGEAKSSGGQGITIEAGTNHNGDGLRNELPPEKHERKGQARLGGGGRWGRGVVRGVLPGSKSLLPGERISPHIPCLGYSRCPAADKWVYLPSPRFKANSVGLSSNWLVVWTFFGSASYITQKSGLFVCRSVL